MASQSFTYAPIDTLSKDIRLLRLSDRSTPGPPSCEIFHASLKDDIKYEALSYSWGDPKLKDCISLNGNVASITVNLTRALEDIRLDHGTRVLWVDALCINQENTTERNHQVKQMGAIYQKAERVVAWLGRPKSLEAVNTASILDSLEESFDLSLEYAEYLPNLKAQWLELIALCELPYWHRLWIVQEIGLAAELHVYHGRSYKDWKVFSKIRKGVERAKRNIRLHESLQGIAKTITESVPGRLDQQREYRQPLWLGEMHATMQHLLSRARTAARAAKILSELSTFSENHFGRSRMLPKVYRYDKSGAGRPRRLTTKFGILKVPKHRGSILRRGNLDSFTSSEEDLRFMGDGAFENTEHSSQRSIVVVLEDWKYELRSHSFPFAKDCLRFISDIDFERTEYTGQDIPVTIPGFLPLDEDFAKAYNNLPKHIEFVRAHERQRYHEELKKNCEKVSSFLSPTNFSGRSFLRLLHLLPEFHNSQEAFRINRVKLEDSEREWKARHRVLEAEEIELKARLEAIRKIDLSAMIQPQQAHFEELAEQLEKEELRCRSEIEKMELWLEENKLMKRGLTCLNARYQEVTDFLEACQKFDTALRDFDKNLESDAETQQPGFILRTLLETCERSLCQDPRDKVYGLLGLASNVKDDELPVDYSKSMFELFWDVVWLTYKQESGSETPMLHAAELIRFSQLMQRSLGGPFPVDNKFQGDMSLTEHPFPQLVHLSGFITGTVLVLEFGDSETAFARYQTQSETLKQYFRGQARQSSTIDMVAAALEQLQHVDRDRLRPFTANYSYGTTNFRDPYHAQQQNTRPTRSMSPQAQPVLFVEDSGMIGLASCNVRSNDLLVQFQNCDIAAIIRRCGENEAEFRLVGRAVVARKFGEERKTVSESSPELFKYSVPDNSTLHVKQGIWLWLDAVTLQELTCPVSERREYNFDTLVV